MIGIMLSVAKANLKYFITSLYNVQACRHINEITFVISEVTFNMKKEASDEFPVDMNMIHIDTSLPKEQRIKKFVEDIKNPYCFRVGNVIVRTSFKQGSPKLQETMKEYFKSIK